MHPRDTKQIDEILLTHDARIQALAEIRRVTLEDNNNTYKLETDEKRNLSIVLNTLDYIANNAEK